MQRRAHHLSASRASTSSPSVIVRTSFDDVPAGEIAAWDDLASRTGAPVYQTPAWASVWWRHYGHRRQLQLFSVFHEGASELVAVVPMFVERIGRAGLAIRVAKPVAADFTIANFAFIGKASRRAEVLGLVADMLIADGCDLVSFGPMRNAEVLAAELRSPSGGTRSVSTFPHRPPVLMTLDLSDGYDSFVATLSRSTRTKARRQRRALDSMPGVTLDILEGNMAVHEFPKFIELHQTQWRALGRQGHFEDWPHARAFHTDLVAALAGHRGVVLYRLSQSGEPVAYDYIHRHGAVAHSILRARSLDERWRTVGPGNTLFLAAIEHEAELGATRFDLGQGHYDYKRSQGGDEVPLDRLRVTTSAPARRVRVQLWCRLSELVHLVYYRIWFSRVKPRIGRQHGTIARVWIRTRL